MSRMQAVERINLFKKCFRDRDDGYNIQSSPDQTPHIYSRPSFCALNTVVFLSSAPHLPLCRLCANSSQCWNRLKSYQCFHTIPQRAEPTACRYCSNKKIGIEILYSIAAILDHHFKCRCSRVVCASGSRSRRRTAEV